MWDLFVFAPHGHNAPLILPLSRLKSASSFDSGNPDGYMQKPVLLPLPRLQNSKAARIYA